MRNFMLLTAVLAAIAAVRAPAFAQDKPGARVKQERTPLAPPTGPVTANAPSVEPGTPTPEPGSRPPRRLEGAALKEAMEQGVNYREGSPEKGKAAVAEPSPREEPPAAESGDGAASSTMSLDDAKYNFATVVEAYVKKNSRGGQWTFKEKGGKTSRKLTLVSIDKGGVRKSGRGFFSGPATFKDAGGKTVTVRFTVDFSGSDWKVKDASLQR